MATGSTLVTVSGTPSEFLPLPTPWPSGTGCDQYIYQQQGGRFLAWDPLYGESFDTSAQSCLPAQVTSWWHQSDSATPTALGPTFVCPEAYYAVQTALIASQTQQVFCCPSDYSLFVLQPNTAGAFPSQCTSTVNPGETISFISLFEQSSFLLYTPTVSTVQSDTVTVFGIPVNGFNIAQSTSSASESTERTTPSVTGTPTTTSIIASSTSSSKSSSPSLGTSVGVSVGCVFAVLILALCGFLFWRRRRRRQSLVHQAPVPPKVQGFGGPDNQRGELQETGVKAELYGGDRPSASGMYELPASNQFGR